ncbi:MAG: PleD family two-component response regulator [Gammaproteobacteria bacterium]|jgi:PleD family two-component response regulator
MQADNEKLRHLVHIDLTRGRDGSTIAARIAGNYHRAIADIELDYDVVKTRVTSSIGAATRRSDHRCPRESLLKQADQALYQARHLGRNRYFADNESIDSLRDAVDCDLAG